MKKSKRRHKLGPGAGDPLKDILALEKTLTQQLQALESGPAIKPPAGAASARPKTPFPLALGRHLLARLTALEAMAGRLAERAERQGDYKTSLRALQVSVRIISTTVRLVDKHPHLAEDWQPPQENQPAMEVQPPAPGDKTLVEGDVSEAFGRQEGKLHPSEDSQAATPRLVDQLATLVEELLGDSCQPGTAASHRT